LGPPTDDASYPFTVGVNRLRCRAAVSALRRRVLHPPVSASEAVSDQFVRRRPQSAWRHARVALGAKSPRRNQLTFERPIPAAAWVPRQAYANAIDKKTCSRSPTSLRLAYWIAACATRVSFEFGDGAVTTLNTHAQRRRASLGEASDTQGVCQRGLGVRVFSLPDAAFPLQVRKRPK
jgi:hypothetical protein